MKQTIIALSWLFTGFVVGWSAHPEASIVLQSNAELRGPMTIQGVTVTTEDDARDVTINGVIFDNHNEYATTTTIPCFPGR